MGAFAALTAGAFAQNHSRHDILDSSKLTHGMKGYGISVFSGRTPERFEVTILGVAHNYNGGTDMILAELDHPLINAHGVVAGMSGSPVYIDGKLIGAVAFGWGFSNRPVGGIQPIKGMIEVLDQTTADRPPRAEVPYSIEQWPAAKQAMSASTNLFSTSETVTFTGRELAAMGLPEVADEPSVEFRPLASPLMISSSHPLVMHLFDEHFGDSGLRPVMAGAVSGPATGGEDLAKANMVDGGAIAVSFCEGDLFLAAVGTTTFVEGDKLVAFGHPMTGTGSVDMPVSEAEIVAVIPSLSNPFKIGRAAVPAGALRQDRTEGIGITLSQRPELKPLKIRIVAPEVNEDRTFNFRLWEDRFYLPGVASMCFGEAISTVARDSGPMTADVIMDITMEDGRVIRRTQYLSGESLITAFASGSISGDLSTLTNNPIGPLGIRDINIVAYIGDKLQFHAMADVRMRKSVYRPGETVTGTVRFERWRDKPVENEFSLTLPTDIADGRYELIIADSGARRELENATRPELARLKSTEDVYRRLEPNFPANTMWVVLYEPMKQLVIDDHAMGNLPRSIAATTASTTTHTNYARVAEGRILAETQFKQPNRVAGGRRLQLEIRRDLPSASSE